MLLAEVYRIVFSKPRLIASRDGLHIRTSGVLRWDEIAELRICESDAVHWRGLPLTPRRKWIGVRRIDEPAVLSRMSRPLRWVTKENSALSKGRFAFGLSPGAMTAEELLRRLEACRKGATTVSNRPITSVPCAPA